MLVTAISIAALMPCNTADSTHLSTSLILMAIMHDLLSHMYTCFLALLLLSFTSQLCHVCIPSFSPLFTSSLCSSFASSAAAPCVHYQWRRRMTVGLEGRNSHFKCVKAMQTFMVVDARLIPFIPTPPVQLEMCFASSTYGVWFSPWEGEGEGGCYEHSASRPMNTNGNNAESRLTSDKCFAINTVLESLACQMHSIQYNACCALDLHAPA